MPWPTSSRNLALRVERLAPSAFSAWASVRVSRCSKRVASWLASGESTARPASIRCSSRVICCRRLRRKNTNQEAQSAFDSPERHEIWVRRRARYGRMRRVWFLKCPITSPIQSVLTRVLWLCGSNRSSIHPVPLQCPPKFPYRAFFSADAEADETASQTSCSFFRQRTSAMRPSGSLRSGMIL